MAERKLKEIGTYEVKYNKQLRGRESDAFFLQSNFKNPQTKKDVFLLFFPFLFVKKNKMPDPRSDGWGGKEKGRRKKLVGGQGGLAGTIQNTARTIPFLTPPFPSSNRFPHPLFPFFI